MIKIPAHFRLYAKFKWSFLTKSNQSFDHSLWSIDGDSECFHSSECLDSRNS